MTINISKTPPESQFNGPGKLLDFTETIAMGFWGDCFAVVLTRRVVDDNHALFHFLCEDDGYWFVSRHGGSSAWMAEVVEVFQAAIVWIETNGTKDPSGYGWRLPPC